MPDILYVDDSRTSQRMMRRYLPTHYGLTLVDTLAAAWDAMQATRFDLVMTDFLFPEGDAFQLIFKIRHLHPPDRLPVVLITSAVDRFLISKAHAAGVNATVAKPPDISRFRELVERMLAAPWVEQPEVVADDVSLVSWQSVEGCCLYCLNLDIRTQGATPEEAIQRMQERILEWRRTGDPLPVVSSPAQTTLFLPAR